MTRLQEGPATTIELQGELPLVHVARQIWELRHWYGWNIKTGRLPNGVARYSLLGRSHGAHGTYVEPPTGAQGTCTKCPLVLRNVVTSDTKLEGRCSVHGWQTIPR